MPGQSKISRVFSFARKYRRLIALEVLLTLVLAGMAVLPPLITRTLVDRVFTHGEADQFLFLGFLFLAVPILSQLIAIVQKTLAVLVSVNLVNDLRLAIYRHLLYLSLRFFNRTSPGKVVNRLMEDTWSVQVVCGSASLTVVSDLIIATCATVATFAINWRLALVLDIVIAVFVLNYRLRIKKIIRYSRLVRREDDLLNAGVQNRMGGDLAIKTFGTEAREHLAFHDQDVVSLDYGYTRDVANNVFWMNVSLINAMGSATIYLLGCAMVLQGDMTYGDVMAFTGFAVQLLWPAVRFSQLVGQIQEAGVASQRLFELLDEPREITEKPDAVPCHSLRGQVDFEDVHFHYEPGVEVIKGIDLHVKPGQTIAFIGATGCGKSTILNLISRFYDVTGGTLRLDGRDIRDYRLHDLRSQFGIVLQESHLFSTTIRENIAYGRINATDAQVVQAAKAAEIHDFIAGLPKGYDTNVGEDGLALSVGQKQRINIARAICADPAIMIMDEATSSLDSDSEAAIQRAMTRMLANRTSFVVAHRLSTIKNADQIILLDRGVIVEQGTHEELMAIPDGRYRELYNKHIGKGVLDD
ncbi:MAG: ABC transporter ATP-binding protein [Victivallales bacterium]|nr:ABC transporter ATP-binding protein [Victivallales bacterium]